MIVRMPVYNERNGAFARIRGERVLIYWPHGLGDFVHFGYVAPLLDPNNTYAIARFGDDFVHLFDGAEGIAPFYSGVRAIGDGSAQRARHLGLDWRRIQNRPAGVTFPDALGNTARERGISALLYTDYPEYEGRRAFPFHTKARALIEQLVDPVRLRELNLTAPLRNALSFQAPLEVRAKIEARLREFVKPGDRLYLVAPAGHTNPAKIWPNENVVALKALLGRSDPRARMLVVAEDPIREAFGDLDAAFAHVLVTLIRASYAFIGAAAGPLHAAMAMQCCPVAGIWLAHHPDWYDEPYDGAIHLTGPQVTRLRNATTTMPAHWRARTIAFPDRIPGPQDVLDALELVR
jgi:hypothetical protein